MPGLGKEKMPEETARPPGVVTLILPVIPPLVTAVMVVDEMVLNETTGNPPMVTALTALNPVPVMVNAVPAGPATGVKEEIVGGG